MEEEEEVKTEECSGSQLTVTTVTRRLEAWTAGSLDGRHQREVGIMTQLRETRGLLAGFQCVEKKVDFVIKKTSY